MSLKNNCRDESLRLVRYIHKLLEDLNVNIDTEIVIDERMHTKHIRALISQTCELSTMNALLDNMIEECKGK